MRLFCEIQSAVRQKPALCEPALVTKTTGGDDSHFLLLRRPRPDAWTCRPNRPFSSVRFESAFRPPPLQMGRQVGSTPDSRAKLKLLLDVNVVGRELNKRKLLNNYGRIRRYAANLPAKIEQNPKCDGTPSEYR